MSIRPASIENGEERLDYYPGTDEELLEEVLKKVLAIRRYGTHDPAAGESRVRFTLYMPQKELTARRRDHEAAVVTGNYVQQYPRNLEH